MLTLHLLTLRVGILGSRRCAVGLVESQASGLGGSARGLSGLGRGEGCLAGNFGSVTRRVGCALGFPPRLKQLGGGLNAQLRPPQTVEETPRGYTARSALDLSIRPAVAVPGPEEAHVPCADRAHEFGAPASEVRALSV